MIINGDALEVLKRLDGKSVHCCVTSPPYWGLRDYGTATWIGGDPNCSHRIDRFSRTVTEKTTRDLTTSLSVAGEYVRNGEPCPKCGAKRVDLQMGLEKTPDEYVQKLVGVLREVKRVLRDDGTLWLNLGDTYAANRGYRVPDNKHTDVGNNMPSKIPEGLKPKDLVGIPWRVAFALQEDGWYLRADIIWSKTNPMPESVVDRPTKAHEYIFLLAKQPKYYYDTDSVREDGVQYEIKRRTREYNQGLNTKHAISSEGKTGQSPQSEHGCVKNLKRRQELVMMGKRNRRSVWTISTQPFKGAHFAVFPVKLIEPCIKAGTSEKGCCPMCGAGWKRITSVKRTYEQWGGAATKNSQPDDKQAQSFIRGGKPGCTTVEVTTEGWQPTCKCHYNLSDRDGLTFDEKSYYLGRKDAPLIQPVPCTVLDPFAGAGTTGVVSQSLGRNYILIDVNPDYCEMASKRIANEKNKVKK